MSSLGEQLPKEIARVRDEVLPMYLLIGDAGKFGALMIRHHLDDASKAMIEGDVVEMIRCYKELREIKS